MLRLAPPRPRLPLAPRLRGLGLPRRRRVRRPRQAPRRLLPRRGPRRCWQRVRRLPRAPAALPPIARRLAHPVPAVQPPARIARAVIVPPRAAALPLARGAWRRPLRPQVRRRVAALARVLLLLLAAVRLLRARGHGHHGEGGGATGRRLLAGGRARAAAGPADARATGWRRTLLLRWGVTLLRRARRAGGGRGAAGGWAAEIGVALLQPSRLARPLPLRWVPTFSAPLCPPPRLVLAARAAAALAGTVPRTLTAHRSLGSVPLLTPPLRLSSPLAGVTPAPVALV